MEMKEKNNVFEMPKAEIVIFEQEDVITTSKNEGPFVPASRKLDI